MSEKYIIYIVVAVVIAHFLFAVAYLLFKVYSAPKKNKELDRDHDNH